MASIKLPQGYSRIDLYSTTAKPKLQLISDKNVRPKATTV
jgi:hypothetical protein